MRAKFLVFCGSLILSMAANANADFYCTNSKDSVGDNEYVFLAVYEPSDIRPYWMVSFKKESLGFASKNFKCDLIREDVREDESLHELDCHGRDEHMDLNVVISRNKESFQADIKSQELAVNYKNLICGDAEEQKLLEGYRSLSWKVFSLFKHSK